MPSPRFSTSQRPTAARHRPVCDHRQPTRGLSDAPVVPRRQGSGTLAALEAECSGHALGVSACHRGADGCSGCMEDGPPAFCPPPPLERLRSGTWPPKPASQPPSAGRGRKFIRKGGEGREDCVSPTLALAHPLGHGGYLRRRHPACQAPMHFLAISSGIPGGARPAVRHGATAEGHQKVNHSIPTAPNSY